MQTIQLDWIQYLKNPLVLMGFVVLAFIVYAIKLLPTQVTPEVERLFTKYLYLSFILVVITIGVGFYVHIEQGNTVIANVGKVTSLPTNNQKTFPTPTVPTKETPPPINKKEQGTLTIPDVGEYFGEVKNGIADGHGIITYSKGYKYEGEFQNGKKEGLGTYTFANGDKYEVEFKSDKKVGLGTYTFTNGSIY